MPLQILIIALINFVAALLQASTGMGYAIVVMPLMLQFLPLKFCSAISAFVVVAIGIQMVITLRRHLEWKVFCVPVIVCVATTNIGMYMLLNYPERILRIVLSVFLLLCTAYFIYTERRKIIIKPSVRNGVIFGVLTGISTGMFNIVGPFLSIYYFNVTKDNLSFKANLEFSFFIAGLYSLFLHITYGNVTAEVIPYAAASVLFAVAAGVIGLYLYKRLNKETIRKVVCVATPVMALLLLK